MRFLIAAALLVAGCAAAPAPTPPPAEPAPKSHALEDDLAAAIEAGDLQRALATLCAGYAAGGTPCAETVYLAPLGAHEVMSRAGVLHNIEMPPMPAGGGGFAYWDNWSTILSGGTWQPRLFFDDDEEARLVASTLLVSVLAHELGHHVAARHGCSLAGPQEELRADELSLRLLGSLRSDRLDALHRRMRKAADAMIAAVPAERRVEVPLQGPWRPWVEAQTQLPTAVPSYVTLHLSRQRRLLEEPEPYAAVAERLCLGPLRARASTRIQRPGHVETLAEGLPLQQREELLAIDPSARLWGASGSPHVVLRRIDGAGSPVALDLPETATDLNAFAAYSDGVFAMADLESVWLVEHGSLRELRRSSELLPTGLAFDERGHVHAAHRDDSTWQEVDLGAPSATTRLALDRGLGPWADGRLEVAHASPSAFAWAGGEAVFFDEPRSAIRAAGRDEVVTLAGRLPGRRDGAADQASFFGVEAIGALSDGRVAIVERDHAKGTLAVRAIGR